LNATSKEKSDDITHIFCEDLGRIFDQFPRYDMVMFLCDFNAKVGREDVIKPTIGKESQHETSNDTGVRVVYF
jgi:hypothetical protein